MEWVYISQADEPTIYEGDSLATTKSKSSPHIHLLSSNAPVEDPKSDPDAEAEYYGDQDVIREQISPAQAFETFAGKTFPTGQRPDFSGSIYAEATDAVVKPSTVPARTLRLPSSESRSERLARLVAEVDALATESRGDEGNKDDAFAQISALRHQLTEMEDNINANSLPVRLISPQKNVPDNVEHPESQPRGVTLKMISPNVSILSALEQRVAALESSIGVSHLEEYCSGIALAPMLDDVQTRLALITDPTLPERLKKDAQDIANVLHKELQEERGEQVLRTATLLEKMDKWEYIAESVPMVVERLRSLKCVQEEAMHFSTTLASIGKQVDILQQRNETNSTLIQNVQRSLEVNVATVQKNMDLLDQQLQSLNKRA